MTSISASERHDRLMALPPVLRGGFRPFFLSGAVWAVAVVVLWVCALSGAVTLPTAFDALAWHRHEMLFGYLGAVICGFLLTAIPNWTGRLPISGSPLAGLWTLWFAARLAMLFSATTGAILAFVLDVGFFVLLGIVAAREVIKAKNRNLPIVMMILLFAAANALDQAEALGAVASGGAGWRAGIGLVAMMIGLIGGRIIPSFTRNWLAKHGATTGLPKQPGRFDMATLAATALALAAWVAAPEAQVTAILLLAAGALQAARLGRWSGLRAVRDPLVFILHISYAWLPIGLVLLGASIVLPAIPASGAVHALAAGAMASMTLAVMTRATLGHTGRPLHADGWTVAIYALVTAGAALRVAAPWLPIDYMRAIEIAGTAWAGAFLLFALTYGPKLLTARPDGRP
jgi:uncharacterized protein involved in response to NO